jgi:flagellin-like hook-associated protein FlgL
MMCASVQELIRLENSLSPIDKIQTRMGAYDNMFSSASTFKVELDEVGQSMFISNLDPGTEPTAACSAPRY